MNANVAQIENPPKRRAAEWSRSLGCMFHLKGITDEAIVSIESRPDSATLVAFRAGCGAPFLRMTHPSVEEAKTAGEQLATRYGFWRDAQ